MLLKITDKVKATKIYSEFDWIVSILDPGTLWESYGPHHLIVRFEDTEHPNEKELEVMKAGVKKILHFTEKCPADSKLLIHCHAGISRSPAMAWLILIQKGMTPQDAFHLVLKDRPSLWPNTVVLEIGSKILNLGEDFKKLVTQVNTEISQGKRGFLGYGG